MFRLLKYIKQRFPFLWNLIDVVNGYLVGALYGKKIEQSIAQTLDDIPNEGIKYRLLQYPDLIALCQLTGRQPDGFDDYFKPHNFDLKTLCKLYKNPSFLMFGAFDADEMVGYFFIRFFLNNTAFRGKMVDKRYQGRGIAKHMGLIMTDIALNSGFGLFATISKANLGSIVSSKAVNEIKIIKNLPNDYIYVQYTKK